MNKTRVLSTIFLFALATLCPAAPIEMPTDEQQPMNMALFRAVDRGVFEREELAKILESGVDINAKIPCGLTALHMAWSSKTVEQLLLLGADVNAQDEHGYTPLYRADPEMGRILVAYGADVNIRAEGGRTPLHTRKINAAYTRFLIDSGADIHAKDDHDLTPLWTALIHDRTRSPKEEVVRLLIEEGSDVNARAKSPGPNQTLSPGSLAPGDFRQRAPLHLVISNLPHLFPLCVDHGADLNLLDRFGQTLTHYAAESDADVLEFLIGHCGNIHARDNLGRTPLHNAARAGKLDNVRRLVALGADIHEDISGETPVFHAIWEHGVQLETAKFLHQCGADLAGVNTEGATLLHNAAANYGGWPCVEFLLEHGLSVHSKDNAGNTPLHRAAGRHDNLRMIDLLVQHGADVNARNAEGLTPLHLAAKSAPDFDMRIARLIGHGAEIEAVDEHGRTPLFYAVGRYKGTQIAQPLLDAGANMRARDHAGKTLIHYAAMRGEDEWIDHFVVAGLDLNAKDDAGNTPLHDAANDPHMVKKLIEAGADELPEISPP